MTRIPKLVQRAALTPNQSRIAIRNYLGRLDDLDRLQSAVVYLTRRPGLNGPPDPIRETYRQRRMVAHLKAIGPWHKKDEE